MVDPSLYRDKLVNADHRDLKDLGEKRDQMDHEDNKGLQETRGSR